MVMTSKQGEERKVEWIPRHKILYFSFVIYSLSSTL
jgi:hypothetical protein